MTDTVFETSESRGREGKSGDGRLMVAIRLFLMMVVITVMVMMRDSPTSAADPMVETEDETTFFLPELSSQRYQLLQRELLPHFEKMLVVW